MVLTSVSLRAQPIVPGKPAASSAAHDFLLYCADCHGNDGRGHGRQAFELNQAPPDLTILRSDNAGVLPRDRLARVIDGREIVKAHGSREMPRWGRWFKRETEDGLGGAGGDEDAVRRRVQDLIDFIETLQR
jgi:hypothetical protein